MRLLLTIVAFLAPAVAAAPDWGPVQFLVGRWTGVGSGEPGKGTGAFSFTPDLDRHVLVRKSFAEYPPAAGKPAYRHEDLTVVYRDPNSHQLRALYFDNEDHVIPYSVEARGERIVFSSEGTRDVARYRLTYSPAGPDRVTLKFEIAPPGQDLTTYIESVAQREKGEKF